MSGIDLPGLAGLKFFVLCYLAISIVVTAFYVVCAIVRRWRNGR